MASAQDDPRHGGTIWAIHLHTERPDVTALLPARFCRLEPDSARDLTAVIGSPSMDEIRRRFEAGARCYAAWVGSDLAAYGWVSFEEEYVGEFNLWVRLVPGEAYIWDCFTLPAFRQRGLYSALLAHILAELEHDNECRVWIGADMDNVASQRGIARAGFRPIADMVLARVFAMRLVWVQGRPGVPEGTVAEARRAFLDNRDSVWLRAVQMLQESAQSQGQPRGASVARAPLPDPSPLRDTPPALKDPAARPGRP